MNPNKLIVFLAAALVLAVAAIIVGAFVHRQLLKEHEQDAHSLTRHKKALQVYQDSLRAAESKLANRESYWNQAFRNERLRMMEEFRRVNHKTIIYEKAYTDRPPAWDAPQLDSIGDAILARHGRP